MTIRKVIRSTLYAESQFEPGGGRLSSRIEFSCSWTVFSSSTKSRSLPKDSFDSSPIRSGSSAGMAET